MRTNFVLDPTDFYCMDKKHRKKKTDLEKHEGEKMMLMSLRVTLKQSRTVLTLITRQTCTGLKYGVTNVDFVEIYYIPEYKGEIGKNLLPNSRRTMGTAIMA